MRKIIIDDIEYELKPFLKKNGYTIFVIDETAGRILNDTVFKIEEIDISLPKKKQKNIKDFR